MKVNRISLQEADEAAILDYVRAHPKRSRADLARDLGMSGATAGRAVRRLLHGGALREVGQGVSTAGRRPTLLEYNPMQGFVVAVDVGGTSCRTALTDLQGNVLFSDVVPVHDPHSAPLEVLSASIERALERSRGLPAEVQAVAVGVPGIVREPGGFVTRAPNVGWEGVAVGQRLRERFGIPVIVENDVNLAALGEAWRGSAHGVSNFVVVSIGTGIGAGIVAGGDLLRGCHNAAGEVGYLVPGSQYLAQSSASEGRFESLASGPGIVRHVADLLRRDSRPSSLRDLAAIRAADVFVHRAAGDWAGVAVVDELIDLVALLIINLSVIVDPELVILGGSVGLALDGVLSIIESRISGHVPVPPTLKASDLEGQATLSGAISAALSLARLPAVRKGSAPALDGAASSRAEGPTLPVLDSPQPGGTTVRVAGECPLLE